MCLLKLPHFDDKTTVAIQHMQTDICEETYADMSDMGIHGVHQSNAAEQRQP